MTPPRRNSAEIGIPYVLTPLITHSEDQVIPGLLTLEQQAGPRILNGIKAINALQQYGQTP